MRQCMEEQEIDHMKRQAGRLAAVCTLTMLLLCVSCTYRNAGGEGAGRGAEHIRQDGSAFY